MPHLDEAVGALARVAQWIRPRPLNTLERLGAYEGVPMDQLFPAPSGIPEVVRTRRWRVPGVRPWRVPGIRPWRVPGMESEALRFPSQHDPIEPAFREHYHARRRRIQTVTARRIRPSDASGRPRLLYIHGYMQPETPVEEIALLTTMARMLDMEVVQLQPPYHGQRRPRRSRLDGELFWTADVVRSMESLRQTVLDARTLLAWMQAESPTPVGIAGLSLGGSLTACLACLEPGFAFAAPVIAHMDLGALLEDAPVLGAMREDLSRFGWSPRDFGAFFERLGWNELRPVVPRERIHLFAADDDHFFRPELVRDMWESWGRPAIQWYPASHMGFMTNLPDTVRRLRDFVDGRVVGP